MLFRSNAETYIGKLEALDEEYQKMVEQASTQTVLFGDRFPFRYLVDDYGVDYYAAFAGCSAETEASFETVTFLADKMDELKLPAVLTLENYDQQIAQTIIQSTSSQNAQILAMDSMQSVTSNDTADGYTYIDAMKSNLEVLSQALDK